MRKLKPLIIVLMSLLATLACKKYDPSAFENQPCEKRVTETKRNGIDVIQTIDGVYMRAEIARGWPCGSTPETLRLATGGGGGYGFYWYQGKPYKLPFGGEPEVPYIHIGLLAVGVGPKARESAESAEAQDKRTGFQEWWLTPRIPHKLYPIDLLPNWGRRERPDPQSGSPSIFREFPVWAIRGISDPRGRPYLTLCGIKPPPGTASNDVRFERDPAWLVQGETHPGTIGNTCRGGVSASNGTAAGAMIDVPGDGLPDIDKIYRYASERLSTLIVE
jgi:hypothetical protein